jgi:GT2 family glycosyltransferase
MLVRREVFEQAGLLDEDLFFSMEDVELSRRAVSLGWKLAVADGALVFHKGGATVNEGRRDRSHRADLHHARSTGVFLGKSGGAAALVAAPARLAAMVTHRIVRGQWRRILPMTTEFWRGLFLGLRRRGYRLPARTFDASSTNLSANCAGEGASNDAAAPESAARSMASAMARTDVAGNGSVTAP